MTNENPENEYIENIIGEAVFNLYQPQYGETAEDAIRRIETTPVTDGELNSIYEYIRESSDVNSINIDSLIESLNNQFSSTTGNSINLNNEHLTNPYLTNPYLNIHTLGSEYIPGSSANSQPVTNPNSQHVTNQNSPTSNIRDNGRKKRSRPRAKSRVKSRAKSRVKSRVRSRSKSRVKSRVRSRSKSRVKSRVRSRSKSRVKSRVRSRVRKVSIREIILKKSSRSEKKFMVIVDNKTIHFGAKNYSDYTIHKDTERMHRYESRHRSREDWKKSGIKTAGFWSKWILWNKPSILASIKDTERRFGIKIKKQL
jgi:hypothetical protein